MACRFGLAVSACDVTEKYQPTFWIALLFDHLFASKKFKNCATALPESKQSFSMNQHLYLLARQSWPVKGFYLLVN
jgi:hypothetical protein